MLKEAVRATEEEARIMKIKRPLILGVTTLTSQEKRPKIKEISELAKEAKLDGIICSAKEAKSFRQNLGNKFLILTPGIRPEGFPSHDQKRISTPLKAIQSGCDYLIIGRPILEAKEPLRVTKDILKQIYGAKRDNCIN
jgi:orotidine-5'-phosphate decarboxylase